MPMSMPVVASLHRTLVNKVSRSINPATDLLLNC